MPHQVHWAIICQNPFVIVVCIMINERRRRMKRAETDNWKLHIGLSKFQFFYITHIGSRSHRTDLNQIVQFSSSHRRKQSFKI